MKWYSVLSIKMEASSREQKNSIHQKLHWHAPYCRWNALEIVHKKLANEKKLSHGWLLKVNCENLQNIKTW